MQVTTIIYLVKCCIHTSNRASINRLLRLSSTATAIHDETGSRFCIRIQSSPHDLEQRRKSFPRTKVQAKIVPHIELCCGYSKTMFGGFNDEMQHPRALFATTMPRSPSLVAVNLTFQGPSWNHNMDPNPEKWIAASSSQVSRALSSP